MLFLGTQTSEDDLFGTNTPEAPTEDVIYNNDDADEDAAVGEGEQAMDVDEGDPLWSPDIELDATYMKTGDDDDSEKGEKPR